MDCNTELGGEMKDILMQIIQLSVYLQIVCHAIPIKMCCLASRQFSISLIKVCLITLKRKVGKF